MIITAVKIVLRKSDVMVKKIKTSKMSKAYKAKMKKIKKNEYNKCMRCEILFPSRTALKAHLKSHLQAMREIKMLEEGFIPVESKIGMEFKGKNRIIVS